MSSNGQQQGEYGRVTPDPRTPATRRAALLGWGGLLFGLQYVLLFAAFAVIWGSGAFQGTRASATAGVEMAGLLVLAVGSAIVGSAFQGRFSRRTRAVRLGALIALGGTATRLVTIVLAETDGGYLVLDIVVAILIGALLLTPFGFIASAYSTDRQQSRNRRLGLAASWLAVMLGLVVAALLLLAGVNGAFGDLAVVFALVCFVFYLLSASVAAGAFRAAAAALDLEEHSDPVDGSTPWLARREGLLLVAAGLFVVTQVFSLLSAVLSYKDVLGSGAPAPTAYASLVVISGVALVVSGVLAMVAFRDSRRAAVVGYHGGL